MQQPWIMVNKPVTGIQIQIEAVRLSKFFKTFWPVIKKISNSFSLLFLFHKNAAAEKTSDMKDDVLDNQAKQKKTKKNSESNSVGHVMHSLIQFQYSTTLLLGEMDNNAEYGLKIPSKHLSKFQSCNPK